MALLHPRNCYPPTSKKRPWEPALDADIEEAPVRKRARSTGSYSLLNWIQTSAISACSSTETEESLPQYNEVVEEQGEGEATPPSSPLEEGDAVPGRKFTRSQSSPLNEVGAIPTTKFAEPPTRVARTPLSPLSEVGALPRIRLTREALCEFSQMMAMAPPDTLSATSVASPASATSSRRKDDKIGPDHPQFWMHLKARNVLFASPTVDRPSNWKELQTTISQERKSPEPDDNTTEFFRTGIQRSANERGALQHMLPKLLPILDIWTAGDSEAFVAPEPTFDTDIQIKPEMTPRLTVPRPDIAIGWLTEKLPYIKAIAYLGTTACPAYTVQMTWPVFVIEGKGRAGQLEVARWQSLHDSTYLLHSLLKLRTSVGKEEEFFGKVHVMSMEVTTETVQLTAYWATKDGDNIKFYGDCIYAWTTNDPSGKQFREARRGASNALDWVRKNAMEWIAEDMAALEARLQQGQDIAIKPARSRTSSGRKRVGSMSIASDSPQKR